ncbi:DUF4974 domain-containing protein [Chitinophaga sp. Mgbs1]|uniref:DUF4974 domain-containing protein n=1 Tax=Chitinophaga solisilvae TaxID=1233460 RepID=A0A433WG98_9BACT|nr:DUF4974 domain-containing protein [Chitinophaga solisilvae]
MEEQNRIKALLIRFAAGSSNPEERQEILNWLEQHPEAEWLPLPEDISPAGLSVSMPETAADNIFQRIVSRPPEVTARTVRRIAWWRAAAVLIPVIGIGASLWWWQQHMQRRYYVNNTREVQTISLEDGTTVRLNRNSRMGVSRRFMHQPAREVWLEGEAFFSVQPATKAFTVHAADMLEVQVLGTAFNVSTAGETATVVLNTGSVKVAAAASAVVLRPGEMAGFSKTSRQLTTRQADTLFYTSWKYNLVAFRGQPLKEVMRRLQEYYEFDVVFKDSRLADYTFTGYLSSCNLQQALGTLEETFPVRFNVKDKVIQVNKQ